MKTAVLFLNGEAPNETAINHALSHSPEFTLCTDGAYQYLVELQIRPDAIIGDLDSLTNKPQEIDIYHIEDQNTTDFEKALQFLVERKFEYVVVLGSTGGQHDHFLGNLNAAFKFRNDLKICFFDQTQYFFLIDQTHQFKTKTGNLVSLVPFPRAQIIKMQGLKYTLTNETLDITDRVGTRNSATQDEVSIEVSSGALWIFVAY